jgi:hypothetical protein
MLHVGGAACARCHGVRHELRVCPLGGQPMSGAESSRVGKLDKTGHGIGCSIALVTDVTVETRFSTRLSGCVVFHELGIVYSHKDLWVVLMLKHLTIRVETATQSARPRDASNTLVCILNNSKIIWRSGSSHPGASSV